MGTVIGYDLAGLAGFWQITRPSVHPCNRRHAVDEDLDRLTQAELLAEVRKLRAAIRKHRDSTLHELCWHHPDLWGLLPERTDPQPVVPEWPQFMRGCIHYRQSLERQLPDAERSSAEFGTSGRRDT
ncbi:MAG: hypothetical protein ABWY34_07960, partial [Pseudoxanthomonas sp.]